MKLMKTVSFIITFTLFAAALSSASSRRGYSSSYGPLHKSSTDGGDWFSEKSWVNDVPTETMHVGVSSPLVISTGMVNVASIGFISESGNSSILIAPLASLSVGKWMRFSGGNTNGADVCVEGALYLLCGLNLRDDACVRVNGGFLNADYKYGITMTAGNNGKSPRLEVVDGAVVEARSLKMGSGCVCSISNSVVTVNSISMQDGSRVHITEGAFRTGVSSRYGRATHFDFGPGGVLALRGDWGPERLKSSTPHLTLSYKGKPIRRKDLVRERGAGYSLGFTLFRPDPARFR